MLKTYQSKRALHEAGANREDAILEESSPRPKMTRARRALFDVSNNKSRNGEVLDGEKIKTRDTTDRQSLRRLRRFSNTNFPEDRNPINQPETKTAVEPVLPQNLAAKTGLTSQIGETKNNDQTVLSSKGGAKNVDASSDGFRNEEAVSTNANRNKPRDKKRTNEDCFDIESVLLEPRPKKCRKRKKKEPKILGEIEEKRQDPALSLLPSSSTDLTSANCRLSDPLISSDDEHCLLRNFEGPFDASKFTTGIATFDKANEGNVGEVPAYVTDIFQRLFDAEKITRPSPSYMTNEQHEINSTMRAILVDWLVGVQMKFRLQPETLYLCVNIIDRYLSRAHIRRRRLQLLGITALFVACKYEEIYPLEVKDCVYVTDRAYNRQEVLDMECDIVMVLGFKMTVPTAYPFLQRFLHITNAPKMIRDLANFYTERMLQEYCMLNFRASLVASAAVCLAWNNPTAIGNFEEAGIVHKSPRVLDTIVNYTGFCEEEIRHAAQVMCTKIQPHNKAGQNGRHKAQLNKVNMKYRFEAYSNVSCYDLPNANHLDS